MARAQRLVQDALRLLRIVGESGGDLELRRDRLEPGGSLVQRHVKEVLAVDVEQVEEERHDPFRRCVAVDL